LEFRLQAAADLVSSSAAYPPAEAGTPTIPRLALLAAGALDFTLAREPRVRATLIAIHATPLKNENCKLKISNLDFFNLQFS
jgi:hypothetical protein